MIPAKKDFSISSRQTNTCSISFADKVFTKVGVQLIVGDHTINLPLSAIDVEEYDHDDLVVSKISFTVGPHTLQPLDWLELSQIIYRLTAVVHGDPEVQLVARGLLIVDNPIAVAPPLFIR